MKNNIIGFIISILIIVIVLWPYYEIKDTYYNRGFKDGEMWGEYEAYKDAVDKIFKNDITYGTLEIDANSIVQDCLFISKGDGIVIAGDNSTIRNCRFIIMDMGGFCRTPFLMTNDPNY